ncbi:hypothetical protein DFH06DRAFT_904377, partial [Mycena polygramma]
PQELIDATLDHLHDDRRALRVSAEVARSWTPAAQFHLFTDISAKSTASVQALAEILERGPIGGYVRTV